MSGALDNTARNTALKLLQKFGKDAVFKREVAGTFNATTGEMSGLTTTQINITIYPKSPEQGDIQSGLANANDVMILASSVELGDIEVKNGDKIIYDKTVMIKVIKPIYSGNKIALYKFICSAVV